MPKAPEEPPVVLDGTLAFMRSLWALVHALDRRSKWMSTHHGLTGPQRLAVRVIGKSPGVTPGGLAKHLHLHPSTLTGILRRLEDRGFVARAKDSSDSRRNVLVLTTAGRRIEAPDEDTVEGRVAKVLATYSAADIKRLEKLLVALSGELERGLES